MFCMLIPNSVRKELRDATAGKIGMPGEVSHVTALAAAAMAADAMAGLYMYIGGGGGIDGGGIDGGGTTCCCCCC